MRHYERPTIERVKLLVKEDIALSRTSIGGVNQTYNGKSITTYNSTEHAITNESIVNTTSEAIDSGET